MMKQSSSLALAVVVLVAGAGCTKRVDLEKVPVGTAVEVTRQDGGVVTGTLAARDDTAVRIKVGTATRSVPRSQIADVQVVSETPTVLPDIAKFREYTIPAGTALAVRLESAVSSESSRVEDAVQATLVHAVVIDGIEVLPAGSAVTGLVAAVQPAGKVKDRASLSLLFNAITVAGPEGRYPIEARVATVAPTTRKEDIATVALPAAGGAILGAIFGGKKGAGIGALAGGGGTAVVLLTKGPEVRWPQGTLLSPPLDQAIEIRVPIRKQ